MANSVHTPHVTHADVLKYAEARVNLRREDATERREQVNRLRQRLADHIAENPGFALVKMLLSGSLAKGTALSTLNDIDVAVYMKADQAPAEEAEMLSWVADRLREAYGGILKPDQILTQEHSVRVSFRGSGLDVEVVPVYYEGDPDDRGYLIARDTGHRVLTSIPLHLEFIRRRKEAQESDFAQLVRLVKWWAARQKAQRQGFRFKSFMVELICAHLADGGKNMSDYPSAMEKTFAFIVKTGLSERVYFSDYYEPSALPQSRGEPIEVFDPVNPDNNVASGYTDADRLRIVDAAHDALDSLNEAHYSDTKSRAMDCWRRVLGPSFGV